MLGSSGSVGHQALNIIRRNRDKYRVAALSVFGNCALLKEQIEEFFPQYCVVADENAPKIDGGGVNIEYGAKYLKDAAALDADIVVIAVTGFLAIEPLIEAIKTKKRIALANKEAVVCAGEYIFELANSCGAEIIPVDSEHSAIFQCLGGIDNKYLKRIILTASGGALRDLTLKQLESVTVEEALKHPNWNMGAKITIDSATMMNKGLEVIEASRIFGIGADSIECVLHPQSIIHSLAEFCDNSVLAQLSYPDMELPLQFAFTYPERHKTNLKPLDLTEIGRLEFKQIDRQKYPCLELAYQALRAGGCYPAILNCANEIAVDMFLKGEIRFTEIYRKVKSALDGIDGGIKPLPDNIFYIYRQTKNFLGG